MARARSKNNPTRTRVRHLDGSPYRAPIAAGVLLTDNPNRGKHPAPSAGKLTFMDGFVAELAEAERRAYRPLTVVTPLPDSLGRKSRSRSRYTI
jgi:hypothetical protein